jgi:hypothetical protein
MAKIDKSLYTKKQWKLIKENRKKQKEKANLEKEKLFQEALVKQHQEEITKQLSVIEQERKEKKIAFVLGNGTSRKAIDPNQLKNLGKVYGCNALYREFEPDFLIAVDTKMILEINKHGYQKTHEVWTNPNKAYARFKGFNYFQPSKGWSSGPTALWLASEHGNQTIYILGFDYMGLEEGRFFNNVYADTPNYKKSRDSATFFGNWMRQTANVVQSNPQKRYIRVIDDKGYIPKDLQKLTNLEHITVDDFQLILENFREKN